MTRGRGRQLTGEVMIRQVTGELVRQVIGDSEAAFEYREADKAGYRKDSAVGCR